MKRANPARQKEKLHRITLNIPVEMHQEMSKICEERGLSITSFGSTAVELAIKHHKLEKIQTLELENRLKELEAKEEKKIKLVA